MASSPKLFRFLLVLGLAVFVTACGDLGVNDVATITVSPISATVGINQSQLFSAVAKNSVGMIVSATPTWSVVGSVGTISTNGLFTAGGVVGTGYIVATAGSATGSTEVTITTNGWLVGQLTNPDFGFIQNIKVYLTGYETTYYDFSDTEGRYSISGIPAGTYEAKTASSTLFQSSSIEVTIVSGETTTWNVTIDTQPGTPTIPTTTLPSF
ncbi:hypothetical protein A2311_00990 [candidate division WOR-1 bacterium RIFOXYB2_FULL_48_7]|uniref:BIG2 domain-containing protein n=1 Tax=candidate division WOR-1 bacterium RIFOXYB2_FULL_48_7 TaxID=1802583 RepID=A0A1F4TND9_UNCSA|nr:MAG: hypothetical protein A2311_00990 [candidate division WOR-1 bacterium RIFOXYB2_FULL_48_7]